MKKKATVCPIVLGGETLAYTLERKKVKNINLRIKSDGSICVSAPENVPPERIERFLHEKTEYILRARARFAELREKTPAPPAYLDGENVSYLGGGLVLCVRKVPGRTKTGARLSDGALFLYVKNPEDYAERRRVFDRWRRETCAAVLHSCCRKLYPYFEARGVSYPELKFRDMVSRWGSCQTRRGVITFNLALLEAPLACVEYVAAHEMTHFLHPDHSSRFYAELARMMPDWQSRRDLLRRAGIVLRRPAET